MKKSLANNAILNVIKYICSVIFPLVTIPYITDVLGVINYGKYNFANSIISYFLLIAQFGVGTYSIREGARKKETGDFALFVNQIFSISIITTIVSYFLLWLCVFCVGKVNANKSIILVLSITIVLNTIGADWINAIYEDYEYITLKYIYMQLIALVLLFVLVKNKDDYIMYAVVTVIASAGGNLLNIFYVRKYAKICFTFSISLNEHLKSMFILFVNNIALTIYINTDVTMLGFFKSDYEVGLYSIATKVYMIAKQMMNAIVIVALPRFSSLIGNDKKKDYKRLVTYLINFMICIIMPVSVGLFILSKKVMIILSGMDYVNGASSLKILCFSMIFAVLACFYQNCILLPQKKDKELLKATGIAAIINFILNLFVIPKFGYNGAAITTSLSEFIVLLICILSSINIKILINKKNIISTLIGCICIIIVGIIFEKFIKGIFISVLSTVIVSIVCYSLIMLLFRNEYYIKMLYKIIKLIKRIAKFKQKLL